MSSTTYALELMHSEIPILPSGHSLWGVLEKVEDAGDGLILVQVSGKERYVDASLYPKLKGGVGRIVLIGRFEKRWAAWVTP